MIVDRAELPALYQQAVDHNLLSPRELQVLYWWAEGAGIRKTADLLSIHQGTVREHRRRLTRKLEVACTAGILATVRRT